MQHVQYGQEVLYLWQRLPPPPDLTQHSDLCLRRLLTLAAPYDNTLKMDF